MDPRREGKRMSIRSVLLLTVLLVGVLEHVREVRAAVGIAAGLLRPGGVLYGAQPDVEGFAACVNAPYQQFSTEHVNFFSTASLTRLLATAELAPVATWRWLVEWREGVTDFCSPRPH